MSYVNTFEMISQAQEKGYAVGAFNVENMEMVQAVIEAAEQLKAPVILQTTPSTVSYGGLHMFQAMIYAEAVRSAVPVALHLDHGSSYELCRQAVGAEYSSVMIDGSKLPFEENIMVTKRVTEAAKLKNISVEAELGTIGGKEDNYQVSDKDAAYTNPGQAKEFVQRTGVDSLAIAIGTAHGFYKGTPNIDMEGLAEIRKILTVPLVLHGGTGIPKKMIQEAVKNGISKVNFATELRAAYTSGVRRSLLEEENAIDPKKYGTAAKEAVKRLVEKKMKICGCVNRI